MYIRRCYPFLPSSDDTGDSWGDLTLTHEVDVLFKRFSKLNVSSKITLKTKVRELAFLDTTSMCPCNENKNKGCIKVYEIYQA